MKTKDVMKSGPLYIILIAALSVTIPASTLFGQNAMVDKQMKDIDSYKKYKVLKINDESDLEFISDGDTDVLELANYMRKSKNDHSGKVTESSKTKTGTLKRTYYFNKNGQLIAIIDGINSADNKPKKLTYYFAKGQLTNVIDENNNDVTHSIDQQQLYYWIKRMFDERVLKQ